MTWVVTIRSSFECVKIVASFIPAVENDEISERSGREYIVRNGVEEEKHPIMRTEL